MSPYALLEVKDVNTIFQNLQASALDKNLYSPSAKTYPKWRRSLLTGYVKYKH